MRFVKKRLCFGHARIRSGFLLDWGLGRLKTKKHDTFEGLNLDSSSSGFQAVQIWGLDFRKFSFRDCLKSCKSPGNQSSLFISHAQCRQQQEQQSISPGIANKLNPDLERPYSGEVNGNSISELSLFWLVGRTANLIKLRWWWCDEDPLSPKASTWADDVHGGPQNKQSHRAWR